MERWSGKVAVVTGASSGIGFATCKDLLQCGLTVIGLARRVEKIQDLKSETSKAPGTLYARYCDLTKIESINEAFDWIEREFGHVNILINNAGMSKCTMLLANENNEQDLMDTISTNLTGLILCTRRMYKMLHTTDEYGHIVNLNSILGHHALQLGPIPTLNVYPGTKFAITATTEVLRQELNYLKNNRIRVSNISPGLVKTEIFESASYPNSDQIYSSMPYLKGEDVSQGIMYILGTPPHVQIHDLIIKPVGETF